MPAIISKDLKISAVTSHGYTSIDQTPVTIQGVSGRCRQYFQKGTQVKVLVPIQGVKYNRDNYNLIRGRVILQTSHFCGYDIEVPCCVAFGRWDKISQVTRGRPETYWDKNGSSHFYEVDLVPHFGNLLPKTRGVGLFTCQNGIQNDWTDFEGMCQAITGKINKVTGGKQKPLFIGLYNPTNGKQPFGFLDDMTRLLSSWKLNPLSAFSLRQLFVTLLSRIPALNPNLLWAHIAHSEAGLLANHCLTDKNWGLSLGERDVARKKLITLLYGGVALIPENAALRTFNNYSARDVAFWFARDYVKKFPRPDGTYHDDEIRRIAEEIHKLKLDKRSVEQLLADMNKVRDQIYIRDDEYIYTSRKNGYYTSKKNGHVVRVLKCITKSLTPVKGDHTFLDPTYQGALEENLIELNEEKTFGGIVS